MILKVLLIVAIIAVVYFLFIKKKPLNSSKKKDNEKPKTNDMVECATCGTYVSIDDAIISENRYYCCSECVDNK